MTQKRLTMVCALGAIILLSACDGGSVQETLGLDRKAPDEFKVVSRPPLSVPPQFNLRPPAEPGDVVVNPYNPGKQAESLILGTQQPGDTFNLGAPTTYSPSGPSAATGPEQQLLTRAGASSANPDIRRALAEDKRAAAYTVEEEDSWWNVFSTTPAKKDPVVDASKEAERIKKNQEEGKPVNEGDTPEVKSRDTGVLGRILGY